LFEMNFIKPVCKVKIDGLNWKVLRKYDKSS
jgi:hypothetical protein